MAESAGVSGFTVDVSKCIGCGVCVKDCVARVLRMAGGKPEVNPDTAEDCIGCQHCLAVCPTAAVGVRGLVPENSASLAGFTFDAAQFDRFIAGRRSIRQWSDKPVPKDLLEHVLRVSAHAPTGSNNRNRRLIVIHDTAVLHQLRDEILQAVRAKADSLPEADKWLLNLASAWLDDGRDILFRYAPHLLLIGAPHDARNQMPDCMIEMSYFDLIAQAHGIGTTWCGFMHYVLQVVPEFKPRLGIPEDFMYAYAMMFGMPTVRYHRTAQYAPEEVMYLDHV